MVFYVIIDGGFTYLRYMSSQERAIQIAHYIIDNRATVRDASKVFGISKSTVHKDVSYKLKSIDSNLFELAKKVLDYNLSVRHIRGGESTKNKYKRES